MTEDKNRYPHNFKKWQDIRIDQYHTAKAEKDAEERLIETRLSLIVPSFSSINFFNAFGVQTL